VGIHYKISRAPHFLHANGPFEKIRDRVRIERTSVNRTVWPKERHILPELQREPEIEPSPKSARFGLINAKVSPPGGFSQKKWVGVCDPLPKNLTVFMTKICDIPYPIYDLTKIRNPIYDLTLKSNPVSDLSYN